MVIYIWPSPPMLARSDIVGGNIAGLINLVKSSSDGQSPPSALSE